MDEQPVITSKRRKKKPEIVINPALKEPTKIKGLATEGTLGKSAGLIAKITKLSGKAYVNSALEGMGFKKIKPKKIKEAFGYRPYAAKQKKIEDLTPDEHLKHMRELSQKAKKFGKTGLGRQFAAAAGRHLHHFLAKDKSHEGALKAHAALHEVTDMKTLRDALGLNEAFEKGLEDHEPRIVSGVKGMKSKPFKKKFRNQKHMEKWMNSDEAGDHEVHHVYKEGFEPEAEVVELDEAKMPYDQFVGKGHHVWSVNYDHARWKGKNVTLQTKEKSEDAVRNHRFFKDKKGKKINSITHKGIRESMNLDEAKRGRPRKVQDAESNEHINMQLRKAVSLRGRKVKFANGEEHHIHPDTASKALHMHDTKRTSIEKGEFAKRLAHSHQSFKDAVAGKEAEKPKPKITLGHGFGHKFLKKKGLA